MNGQIVSKGKLISSEVAIDFLPNGVYWLSIFDEENVQIGIKKVVKI